MDVAPMCGTWCCVYTGLPRRKIGKIIEIVKIRRVQTRVAQLSRTVRLVYKKTSFFK